MDLSLTVEPGSAGDRPVDQGGELLIVAIKGELDTNTSGQLEVTLEEQLQSGVRQIVLDMTAMDYVSSVGLRVCLAYLKKLKSEAGSLMLAGLNEEVQEVFDMAGFSGLFEIFPSLDDVRARHQA